MKRLCRLCGCALLALAVVAALTYAGRRIRARWLLPETELTVLRYERVRNAPSGTGEVTPDLFQEQLADLCACGYRSVSPEQLRRRFKFGDDLPDRPVLILLGVPSADLVVESESSDDDESISFGGSGSLETILSDLSFTAVVGLPVGDALGETPDDRRASPDETPLLAWSEIKAAERRGVLSFAALAPEGAAPDSFGPAARALFRRLGPGPRILLSSEPAGSPALRALAEASGADWAIGSGDRAARVGARTDPFDMPSVAVVGGRHLFSVRLVRDSVDPSSFGKLLISHADGPDTPFRVVLYDQKNRSSPLLSADLPALSHSETSSVALPAGIRFPLSVYFYDPTGSVFYHRRDLTRREAESPAGYRSPVGLPDEEVPFEPL